MTFTLNLDENMEFLWSRYGVNNEDGEPKPYEIIEGNIGVINPAFMNLQSGAVHGNEVKWAEAMNALKDTDGLIVDYRQYPANSWQHLPPYLLKKLRLVYSLRRFLKRCQAHLLRSRFLILIQNPGQLIVTIKKLLF